MIYAGRIYRPYRGVVLCGGKYTQFHFQQRVKVDATTWKDQGWITVQAKGEYPLPPRTGSVVRIDKINRVGRSEYFNPKKGKWETKVTVYADVTVDPKEPNIAQDVLDNDIPDEDIDECEDIL